MNGGVFMDLSPEIIQDISERLYKYDTIRPRIDELKFIKEIGDDYNLNRKETIKLIQTVRRLNKG